MPIRLRMPGSPSYAYKKIPKNNLSLKENLNFKKYKEYNKIDYKL